MYQSSAALVAALGISAVLVPVVVPAASGPVRPTRVELVADEAADEPALLLAVGA